MLGPSRATIVAMKILFVDDEIELAASVKDLLEDLGHEVTCLESVSSALETLQHKRPDLIIIDFHMPVQNGLELMREGRDLIKDIPTFLLTGHIKSEDAIVAKQLGFKDVFIKPIALDNFVGQLEQNNFSLAPKQNSGIIEE